MSAWEALAQLIQKEAEIPERNKLKRLLDVEVGKFLGGKAREIADEWVLQFTNPNGVTSHQIILPHYTRNFHEALPLIVGKEIRIAVNKDDTGEVAVWIEQKNSKIPKIYKQEFDAYEIPFAMVQLFLRTEEDARIS